ncbi:MAG TPA: Hsp20/alpha crystallin family protein [Stellaceae bacterium]|nr:Hsp20/alpha crystallin family protein [Stellaceae bacterium]
MAQVPVEAKKTTPAPTPAPDVWHSFRSEMDRLFDRFAEGFHLPSLRRMFEPKSNWIYEGSFSFSPPAVDVTEDDKTYRITAEVPGLEQNNVEVIVSGDMLTFKGEKHHEKEEKDKNHYMSERSYGSFQRSFELPDSVDREKISADLSKGVLTITLPKTAAAQKPTKKIEVKAAA